MCKKCDARTATPLAGTANTNASKIPLPPIGNLTKPDIHEQSKNTRRKRKKIWELNARWHCPLIGTCLPIEEIRKIAAREGYITQGISEYDLHGLVVMQSHSRTDIAEQVQRFLEKRYAVMVTRFSRVKNEDQVIELWQECVHEGNDVAGALWAAWSHADINQSAGEVIFGDIHMLSHQIGSQSRADLRLLAKLKSENQQLRLDNKQKEQALDKSNKQKDKKINDLEKELQAAEQKLNHFALREQEFQKAASALQEQTRQRDRADTMAQRAERLEKQKITQQQRIQSLEQQLDTLSNELDTLTSELAASETALQAALTSCNGSEHCDRSCPPQAQLAGRCVLCIGGRTGMIEGYRRLVETNGGRFIHHDGGQEESLHRIDAFVSAADAVVCQSSCVSHSAYWKLKEACKKLEKPCVFVQSPGIGSFARSLSALTGEAPVDLATTTGRTAIHSIGNA